METVQPGQCFHKDPVPDGIGVRSGSPGVVGVPRLLLCTDSQDRDRQTGCLAHSNSCCGEALEHGLDMSKERNLMIQSDLRLDEIYSVRNIMISENLPTPVMSFHGPTRMPPQIVLSNVPLYSGCPTRGFRGFMFRRISCRGLRFLALEM